MNWYKTAQSLSQGWGLNLNPSSFTSALPQSLEAIKKLGLEDILEDFAQEKGYEEALDYVLCSLYPEFEKECRDYYANGSKKIVDLHPKQYIKKLDSTLVAGILAFYRKYKQLSENK